MAHLNLIHKFIHHISDFIHFLLTKIYYIILFARRVYNKFTDSEIRDLVDLPSAAGAAAAVAGGGLTRVSSNHSSNSSG